MINLYFVYQFVKMISTPFNKWELFDLGIIDEKGNTLKRKRDLKTPEEKRAMTPFVILVRNIKQIIERFGKASKFSSYAAALYLIKEHKMFTNELTESFEEVDLDELAKYVEEEIANNTATVTDGKPVVSRKNSTKYKNKNKKEKHHDTDT